MSLSLCRPPRRRSSVVLGIAVAIGLLVTGCGDDSSEGSDNEKKTVAFGSWQDQVNKMCITQREAVESLDEPAADDDFEGIVEWATATKKLVNEFIDDVEALGTPDKQAKDAEAFIDEYRTFTVQIDKMIAAARDEDAEAVTEAGEKIDAETRRGLAEDLGLDDCYKDEGELDDTTDETLTDNPTTTTSDDADDSGNLPQDEWSAEIDQACADLEEQYSYIEDMDPQTQEEIEQLAAELRSFAGDIVAEWDRVGPPQDDDGTAQELYDLFVKLETAAGELEDAVVAQDDAAVTAATDQLDALGAEINPLAEQLDVPRCGGF